MRLSVACSSLAGGGQNSSPLVTRTRQVEQRARPPHIAACGRWKLRLASSTDQPRGTRTVRPGIRQRDEALAAPLDQIADFARDESRADDGEIPVEEIVLPLRDRQPLHGVVRI